MIPGTQLLDHQGSVLGQEPHMMLRRAWRDKETSSLLLYDH